MFKKYICIPRSFLVINVCNQGKTLCSPCRLPNITRQHGVKFQKIVISSSEIFMAFRPLAIN